MDVHVLNGRRLEDWELAALERAREREREQALGLLAGVLADDRRPVPEHGLRPVTDLVWEFGRGVS